MFLFFNDDSGSKCFCFVRFWNLNFCFVLSRAAYLKRSLCKIFTAWKVSKYGVFLVRIFRHSDWIRRDTPYHVKVSKYGVFPGPYFPAYGEILRISWKCPNTEIFTTYLFVFSPNAGKYGPAKTPYLDTFHAVIYFTHLFLIAQHVNTFSHYCYYCVTDEENILTSSLFFKILTVNWPPLGLELL